jgi:hypothetical protein
MDRLRKLISEVCELAREAGKKIMRFYDGGATVTWMAPSDLSSRTLNYTLVIKTRAPE